MTKLIKIAAIVGITSQAKTTSIYPNWLTEVNAKNFFIWFCLKAPKAPKKIDPIPTKNKQYFQYCLKLEKGPSNK